MFRLQDGNTMTGQRTLRPLKLGKGRNSITRPRTLGTDNGPPREPLHSVLGAGKTGERTIIPPETVSSLRSPVQQINGQYSAEGAFVSYAYTENTECLLVQNSEEISLDARNATSRITE